MRRKIMSWVVSLLVVFSNSLEAVPSEYRVGPGDELAINFPLQGNLGDLSKLSGNSLSIQVIGEAIFWNHQVLVAPDGFISLPSLPPIRVSGLTLEEIQQIITQRLARTSPLREKVAVVLKRPNSTAFYVWGEVKTPGRFVFERPTTLMEAIGAAGGSTDRARLKAVTLLRGGASPMKFNLSDRYLEKHGPPDVDLRPSDTVVIPRKKTPDLYALFILLTAITAGTGIYVASKID